MGYTYAIKLTEYNDEFIFNNVISIEVIDGVYFVNGLETVLFTAPISSVSYIKAN